MTREQRRPFYWTRPHLTDDEAPAGWYQWTDRGLVYLGESILERDPAAAPAAEGPR